MNPTEKVPAIPTVRLLCPACGEELKGMNISGMKLPIPGPDGKPSGFLNFLIPCCPHCSVILAVQFTGQENAPSPGAAAGLWTPPGSH